MPDDVLLTGLSLIQDSPFKTSQSPNPNTGGFAPSSPLMNQYDDKNFDNLYNYLKSDYKDHLSNGVISNPGARDDDGDLLNDSYKYYLSELSNNLINKESSQDPSQPTFSNLKDIKLSENIKNIFDVTKNSNTNDLILKILIENAMYNLNLFLESKDEFTFLKSSLKKTPQSKEVFDNHEILSLDEIKSLKREMLDLLEQQAKLVQEIDDSTSALQEVLIKYEAQESSTNLGAAGYQPSSRQSRIEIESISNLNNKLERKLISSSLQKYLTSNETLKKVNEQVEKSKKRLFSHFFTCLVLGYINNITVNLKLQKNIQSDTFSPISTPRSPSFPESFRSPLLSPLLRQKGISSIQMVENKTAIFNKSIDEIVSFVASLAVQKDIQLPEPVDKRSSMMISNYNYNNNNEILNKTAWVKKCINKILSSDQSAMVNDSNLRGGARFKKDNVADSGSSETTISEFSKYTKDNSPYNSRSSSVQGNRDPRDSDLKTKVKDLKFANDYLTKQFKTERESFNKILNEQNLIKMNLERKLSNSITNLEKTNVLLMQTDQTNQQLEKKVDENFKTINELQKLITTLKIENLGHSHSQSPNKHNSEVSLDENDLGTHENHSSAGIANGMSPSAGIMRSEFKKIIDDMNDKHFKELSNEITERKRLESLVLMYKEKLESAGSR